MASEDLFDDDLFEFDEFGVDDSVIEDDFLAPVEGAAEAAAAPDSEPEPAAGPAPASAPGEASSGFRGMGTIEDFEDDFEDEHEERLPAARASLPPIVTPLLLIMAVGNLALVGLTWKSMKSKDAVPVLDGTAPLGQAPRDLSASFEAPERVSGDALSPAVDARGPSGSRRLDLRSQLPQLTSSRDDAWAILEEAQRALEAGEFTPARRALYSMLTVVDRVDQADRLDIESRAGFLIAESYRLQAEALGALEPGEEQP